MTPKDKAQFEVYDQRASFTVPSSGRRYTIYLEDWDSIQVHMAIAKGMAKQTSEEKK